MVVKTSRKPLPCDHLSFVERLRQAAAWQAKDPGYSTCFRCHLPWSAVNEKCVWHPQQSGGGFALCEACWNELGTTDARMPFYLLLPPWWASQDPSYVDQVLERMERMREAVIWTSEHDE